MTGGNLKKKKKNLEKAIKYIMHAKYVLNNQI